MNHRLLLATSVSLTLIVASAILSCGSSAGEPVFSIGLTQREVSLHEPVFVEVTVDNTRSKPIEIDLGVAEVGALRLEVVPRDGGSVESSGPPIGPVTFHAGGKVNVEPGESYRSRHLLSRWFAITSPGRYDVVAEFTGAVHEGDSTAVEVARRFVLPLEVTPRDPERLQEAARSLAETACQNRDLAAAHQAATALGSIDDPVVVPFLEGLLGCSYTVQVAAASGLGRIGTTEAITALLGAAESGDPNLAEVARTVLRNLLTQESAPLGPELRDRIGEVLRVPGSGRAGGQDGRDNGIN